jgi:hypothetical protein
MTSTPSLQQLQRAIQIAEQIDKLEQELKQVLSAIDGGWESSGRGEEGAVADGSKEKKAPSGNGRRKKRVFSPEAREKMAAAQRRRWAKKKRQK